MVLLLPAQSTGLADEQHNPLDYGYTLHQTVLPSGWYRLYCKGHAQEEHGWRFPLAQVLFQYQATPHDVTGYAPCELLLGRIVKTPLDVLHLDYRSIALVKQKRAPDRGCHTGPLLLRSFLGTPGLVHPGPLGVWSLLQVPHHCSSAGTPTKGDLASQPQPGSQQLQQSLPAKCCQLGGTGWANGKFVTAFKVDHCRPTRRGETGTGST